MIVAKYIAVALLGYLLGSIPFGVIIGKRSARIDVREDLERDKAKERGNSDGQKFQSGGDGT